MLIEQVKSAKEASFLLAAVKTETKNKALAAIADALEANREAIIAENKKDLERAKQQNVKDVLVKRLAISDEKVNDMIRSVRSVIGLDDPVGKTIIHRELDDSLVLRKYTVPIGVIGVIFEARPDALVQISSLCVKSGNVVILKGGSEASRSNKILYDILKTAAENTDPVFKNTIHLAETREEIRSMLSLDAYIDLLIPRGSNELVKYIIDNTRIPVLGHASGICHLYIDEDADLDMALSVAYDAKCQYPAVCNAIETLLVHRNAARDFLPRVAEKLAAVELRGDAETRSIIQCRAATEEDWSTEYNDLVLSIKIVDSLHEAIHHINLFGSHHTDAIITRNESTASRFLEEVDSSSVMWNCSTRFADGFRYGLGAEVGISTYKIHARGPVGLEGLTSTKFRLEGKGHIVGDYATGKKTFKHRDIS